MKVHYGLDKLPPIKNAVVTSGTFDGVHFGHRKIIDRINQIAQDTDGESVVITFWPHPRLVLQPERTDLCLLSTLDEKIELLKETGLDHLLILPFTKQFSQLSSLEFIQSILVEALNTKNLVIGYDHKFGKNREGSFQYLVDNQEKFGFNVEEISAKDINNITISSTKIRNALKNGNIPEANLFLSSPYHLTGKVILGEQIGRKIGFPTANLSIEETFKLIPQDGVYAVKVKLQGQEFKGMLNIGTRPTVAGKNKTIEVHIFDFHEEIYNQTMSVTFFASIRKEQKFNDIHELQEQLVKDKEEALLLLNKE